MAEAGENSYCKSCTPARTRDPGQVLRTVTLVHGTFKQHAPWMQDDHPLPRRLQAEGIEVYRFCWSGANLHTDRLAAGTKLHQHLVNLVTEFPEAEHHVVAHSHGGNVALYALRDEHGDLDTSLENVRVTTLATPFLSMRWRRLPRLLFWLIVSGPLALIAAIPLAFVTPWLAAVIAPLAVASLVVLAILTASLRIHRRGDSTNIAIENYLMSENVSREIVEREAKLLRVPDLEDGRLFVIRADGDEAGYLLGAARFASRLWAKILAGLEHGSVARGLVNYIAIFVNVGFVAVLLWGVIGALNEEAILRCAEEGICESWWLQLWAITSFEIANVYLGVAFAGLVAFVVGVPIVSLGVSLLLATANLPFGRDMLFWNLRSDIKVRAAPEAGPDLRLSRRSGRQLAHSVYEDDDAVKEVVARVASRSTGAPQASTEPTVDSEPTYEFKWRSTYIPFGPISAIAITSVGRFAICCFGESDDAPRGLSVQVWNLDTGNLHSSLTAERTHGFERGFEPMSFTMTPDGKRLIAVGLSTGRMFSNSRNLSVWDLTSGVPIRTLRRVQWRAFVLVQKSKLSNLLSDRVPDKLFPGRAGRFFRVNAITATPDGQRVISANSDKTLQVWNPHTGSSVAILKGHSTAVERLAVSSDSRYCISWGPREVIVWDLINSRRVAGVDSDGDSWSSSPDGQRAITKALRIFERNDSTVLAEPRIGPDRPNAVLSGRLVETLSGPGGWWKTSAQNGAGHDEGNLVAWGFNAFVTITGAKGTIGVAGASGTFG